MKGWFLEVRAHPSLALPHPRGAWAPFKVSQKVQKPEQLKLVFLALSGQSWICVRSGLSREFRLHFYPLRVFPVSSAASDPQQKADRCWGMTTLQMSCNPLPGAGQALMGRKLYSSTRNHISVRGWWLGVVQFGCAALGPESST